MFLVPRLLAHYNISGENFQGAIILETILNYDETDNSQNLPEFFALVSSVLLMVHKGKLNKIQCVFNISPE